MLIQKIKRELLRLGDWTLAINPDTGAWLMLEDRCIPIISAMETCEDLKDIYSQFPNIEPADIVNLLCAIYENEARISETLNTCESCNPSIYPTLAVLKLTEACNMHCKYCYVNAGSGQTELMTTETARRIIDEYLKMHEEDKVRSNITFHGGEPLLNFQLIQEITDYVKPYRDKVLLSIQTNGTMITDEIAEFLKENNINVGISIDGHEAVNDVFRQFPGGEGTFRHIMRGIETLNKHQVSFGIISVLSSANIRHMDEMLDFFISHGIYALSFSAIQPNGRGRDDDTALIDGNQLFEAYKILMSRIIEHNSTHDKSEWLHERYLATLSKMIYENKRPFMCMRAPCGTARNILGFSVNGDIYGCDNFIGYSEFKIGSIYDGNLWEQVINSQVREKAGRRTMQNLIRCRSCIWRGLCGGVCYSSDYCTGANGVDSTDMCVFYQKMIPYMLQQISDNPIIPYLLDPQLEEAQRYIYINITDNTDEPVDLELLEALLSIHNVTDKDVIFLCIKDINAIKPADLMIRAVRNLNATCVVVTDSVCLNGTSLTTLLEEDLQAVQFQIAENISALKATKQFLSLRNRKKEQTCFVRLTLPIDSPIWTPEFLGWAEREFKGQDRITITLPSESDSDYEHLNKVLGLVSGYNLANYVILPEIREKKLTLENMPFILHQDHDKRKYLWIDETALEGKRLDKEPLDIFNRRFLSSP